MRWLALLLLFGCGDNSEGIPLEERYQVEAEAKCMQFARCGLFPDAQSCIAFLGQRVDLPLAGAVNAGVVAYSPILEAECLADLTAVSCDQTSRSYRVRPLSCQGALRGSRPEGQMCRFDSECETARCTEGICEPFECCQGTCKGPRSATGPCDSDIDCFEESYCTTSHACAPLEHELAPCTRDAACDFGLACVSGTCRRLPPVGEACPYDRCADIGARCDASHRCVALGLPGAQCATSADCSPYSNCGAAGVCEPIPLLGMPCTNQCAGNAACVGGNCVAPLENGAPCNTSTECESGLCAEGPLFYACTEAPTCF